MLAEQYAGDFLPAQSQRTQCLYLTEEGHRWVEELLLDSDFSSYRILHADDSDSAYHSPLSHELWEKLCALSVPGSGAKRLTLTLSELRYAPRYELVGYGDASFPVGVCVGMIYRLDGRYAYLNFNTLPDQAFTEAGGLNFDADAEVTLCSLPEEEAEQFRGSLNDTFIELTSESDLTIPPAYLTLACAILFGLLAPFAPITLGICKFCIGQHRGRRRWLVPVFLGGVWFLCGLFITILMGFVLFL